MDTQKVISIIEARIAVLTIAVNTSQSELDACNIALGIAKGTLKTQAIELEKKYQGDIQTLKDQLSKNDELAVPPEQTINS